MEFPFNAFKEREKILAYTNNTPPPKYGKSYIIFRDDSGDTKIPKVYLLYFKFPLLEIILGGGK